jgi:sugar phosphate isomerase/epimerase
MKPRSSSYRFPLAIQTALPEDYRANAEFQRQMQTLQELGFAGVELNLAHPDRFDRDDVVSFLQDFSLKLTMFASGLTAKTYGLSLSSADPVIRQQAVTKCREIIAFAAGTGAGIIFGFFKGGPTPDAQAARAHFRDALGQLAPLAREQQVTLLVEATNRYESSVANSLADTVALIRDFDNPYLRILPDTFHMNIEEADMFAALTRYAKYYDSIHLSDNNRYFPGSGAIRFQDIIDHLKAQGYTGGLAIEGNLQHNFIDDVTQSMAYLAPLLTTMT